MKQHLFQIIIPMYNRANLSKSIETLEQLSELELLLKWMHGIKDDSIDIALLRKDQEIFY